MGLYLLCSRWQVNEAANNINKACKERAACVSKCDAQLDVKELRWKRMFACWPTSSDKANPGAIQELNACAALLLYHVADDYVAMKCLLAASRPSFNTIVSSIPVTS